MKKFSPGGLVGLCAVLFPLNTAAVDVTLPVVGPISVPGTDWREIIRTNEAGAAYRFVVLKEMKTDAMLSFAVYDKHGAKIPNLLTLADSAHELFPTGHRWHDSSSNDDLVVWPLLTEVVRLRLGQKPAQQCLKSSFVTAFEKEPGRNLLAHSRVIAGDVTIFIQHTSHQAITTELVDTVTSTVAFKLLEISRPENLKPWIEADQAH